jgi:hypothetical protein
MSKQNNTSNQGLQKFTNIKTVEDFNKLQSKEEKNEFLDYESQELNKAIADKKDVCKHWDRLGLGSESMQPHYNKVRWQTNRKIIESAISEHILAHNDLPSNNELESITGLSRQTIYKHMKAGAGAEMYKEELESYKMLTGKVLGALYTIGMEERNVKALKTFLDYTGGAPTPPTIKQQNNYLQINNTRIDEVTVNNLPEEARLQLEGIIKQYQPV